MTEYTDNKPSLLDVKTVFVDDDRNTSLHYAAAVGNIQELLKEVEAGHKVDAENYLGWTPLMMAARHGHTEIVQILLDHHADSTKRNKFGYSVFHVAVVSGKIDLITIVLQHLLRGGISRKSMEGVISPLSLAILFNHSHILQYLIDQLFDINSETHLTGLTPVTFAAVKGDAEVFDLLISKGAEVDPKFKSLRICEVCKLKQAQPTNTSYQHIATANSLSPVVILHSSAHHPFVPINPYIIPQFVPRKSSNLESPCFFTPTISPVPPTRPLVPTVTSATPTFAPQQVFFPPDFTPTHFSPVYNFSSDLLNRSFYHSSSLNAIPLLSPSNEVHY